jgi:hypothetical protein
MGHFGRKLGRRALAAQEVERAVACCRHQPGGGIVGHTTDAPDLESSTEGVLDDVFRKGKIVHAEDAR